MAVFPAMYHTFILHICKISGQQHAWKLANTGYILCLNLYTFRIYLELRGARSLFAVIGKLRGMSRKRVCYTFDVHFGSQEEKAAFVCRLKRVMSVV